MATIRPQANEVAIGATANDCGSATLVRVVNPGVANTLLFKFANGNQYASMTVANTSPPLVVQKGTTDLLQGNSMLAVAVYSPSHTQH